MVGVTPTPDIACVKGLPLIVTDETGPTIGEIGAAAVGGLSVAAIVPARRKLGCVAPGDMNGTSESCS